MTSSREMEEEFEFEQEFEDEFELEAEFESEFEGEFEQTMQRRRGGGPRQMVPRPCPAGAPVRILDHFVTGQAAVRSDRFRNHIPQIRAIAAAIVASQSSARRIDTVCVQGHADNRASDRFNLELGRRRALAVRAALIRAIEDQRRGLSRFIRIIPGSSGESQPRASNRTESGRALNRRVEIFISRAPARRPPPPRPQPRPRPQPASPQCIAQCEGAFRRCLDHTRFPPECLARRGTCYQFCERR